MKLSNTDKTILKYFNKGKPQKPRPYVDLEAFKADYGSKGVREGLGQELTFLMAHGFRFLAVDFLGYAWAYRVAPIQDPLTETWTSEGPQASVKSIAIIKGPHPSRFYDLEKYVRMK